MTHGEDVLPLGFAALAYATAGGSDWLNIEGMQEALAADPRQQAADPDLWDWLDMDDPDTYYRARHQVKLSTLLARCCRGWHGCIYCGSTLRVGGTEVARLPGTLNYHHDYHTGVCDGCGWWAVGHRKLALGNYNFPGSPSEFAYGVLREYTPDAVDTPLALAREYLTRNPHRLARFDPFRFEHLMGDCLRDYYGDAEVIKVGGRRDGGIDLKAIRSDGDAVLVQVKRRADFSKRESLQTVRELHGVMLREGIARGMVISTAHDFSRAAKEESMAVGRRLERYRMELLGLNDVVDLLALHGAADEEPWSKFGVVVDADADESWRGAEDWIDREVLLDLGDTTARD